MNSFLFRSLLVSLLSVVLFSSCEDKECQQGLVKAQEELEAYRMMSRGMLQITNMLDSLEDSQSYLDAIARDDTLTRKTVLERIAKSMSTIETGRIQMLEMEENMDKFSKENQGMKKVIATMKATIQQKTRALKALNQRLEEIEDENVSLASAVFEKERELRQKNTIINQQNKDLVYTQNELLLREKEAILAEGKAARNEVMIEATKFYEKGRALEVFADNMPGLFKGKEKQDKYAQAYENYKKAYGLGKSEGKRAMILVKEKMKKKKK